MIILNANHPGVEDVEQLKLDRDLKEVVRVDNLMRDFEKNVEIQEQWFFLFSEHYKNVAVACQKSQVIPEIEQLICQSTLDRWAFHLDCLQAQGCVEKTPQIVLQEFKQDLDQLETQKLVERKEKSPLGTLTEEVICSFISTPLRKLNLAKVLATNAPNSELDFAMKIIDEVMDHCYPAAHLYKAYLMMKKNHNIVDQLDDILKELYAADWLLSQQVSMHYYLAGAVNCFASNPQTVLFTTNAYRKQKENIILLLELLRGSIFRIVGGHCSLEQLSAFGLDTEAAESSFELLMEMGLIEPCHLNPSGRFHDYDKMIATVANNYAVDPALLKELFAKLNSKFKTGFEPNQLKKEIQSHFNTGIFEQDRKAFWQFLVDKKALVNSQSVLGIRRAELASNEVLRYALRKCSMVNKQPIRLCIEGEGEEDDHQVGANENDYLFYLKDDVKSELKNIYKRLKKKHFVANKFAKVNPDCETIEKINEANVWRKLTQDDLVSIGIDSLEVKTVLEDLVQAGIINSEGNVMGIDQKWKYLKNQLYEDLLKNLLGMKSMWRNVWLAIISGNSSAIACLPLNAAKDLTEDLFNSRLIQYPTVSKAINFSQWRSLAGFPKLEERVNLLEFLTSCQAVYYQTSDIDVKLHPVSQLIDSYSNESQKVENISSELAILKNAGFDEMLVFKDGIWTNKQPIKLTVVTTMGLTQIAVGAAVLLLSFLPKIFASRGKDIIYEGLKDIMFAFAAANTRNEFTLNEYTWKKYNRMILKPMEVSFKMLFDQPTMPMDQLSVTEKTTLCTEKKITSQIRQKLIDSFGLVHRELKQTQDEINKSCRESKNKLQGQMTESILKSMKRQLEDCFSIAPKSAKSIFEEAFTETFNDSTTFKSHVDMLVAEIQAHCTSLSIGHKNVGEIFIDFDLEAKALQLLKRVGEKLIENLQHKLVGNQEERNPPNSKEMTKDALERISEEMTKQNDFLFKKVALAFQNSMLMLKVRGLNFESSVRKLIQLQQEEMSFERHNPGRASQR